MLILLVKLNWEEIDSDRGSLYRARVMGGWLVMAENDVVHHTDNGFENGWDWRNSVTFVPDPIGLWN